MKPVLVVRHAKTEGAGFFGIFLDRHQIPWQLLCIDQGDALPAEISSYSGLVMMGGPMSVNDDLPWIDQELHLIQQAMTEKLPVLGHCLGGQLISKALGAAVTANSVKEIGWGSVHATNDSAVELFGVSDFESFHWHGETFALPDGAEHLLASHYCQNQAYRMGNALAFQCHIEMTQEMVKTWCENGEDELRSSISSPGVQQSGRIQYNLAERVALLNQVAANVYAHWIKQLR